MTVLLVMAVLTGPQVDGEPVRRLECARACQVRHRKRVAIRPYRAKLRRIARCESGNNPRAVNPSGKYRGMLQFDYQTWQSVGGRGDPAGASRLEQLYRGMLLYKRRGPAPWPHCGYV
jgi:soluble lytic murein transglycosylase-like protein